ncbi:hypothetical protein BKA67DRAFT_325354 [Truncatella angustata]|uniref:Uncharacterized protein n=1 Tax=Truncatella angustata TaxID=152316 RepID=A0A9P8UKC6_9PEZI|nr:uncharacterized protein BKA67DRAFT_325354 [Truncatella angustata]KAH6653593.1 hypothetical protein BKA67DRAFT_325354 [Truncatella angustata]
MPDYSPQRSSASVPKMTTQTKMTELQRELADYDLHIHKDRTRQLSELTALTSKHTEPTDNGTPMKGRARRKRERALSPITKSPKRVRPETVVPVIEDPEQPQQPFSPSDTIEVHLSDDHDEEDNQSQQELSSHANQAHNLYHDMFEEHAMERQTSPILAIELSDGEVPDREASAICSLRPLFSIPKTSLSRVEDSQGKLDDAVICAVLQVLQQAVGCERLRSVDSLSVDASDHVTTDFGSARILVLIHLPKTEHWVLAHIKEFREEIDVYDSYPLLDDQGSVEKRF